MAILALPEKAHAIVGGEVMWKNKIALVVRIGRLAGYLTSVGDVVQIEYTNCLGYKVRKWVGADDLVILQ